MSRDTEGIDDDFALLNDIRSMLNEYAAAVNTTIGDTGVTPYDAYGHLMRLYREHDVASFPRLRVPSIDSWTGADFQGKATVVSELQTILGSLGVPKGHIFRGSNLRVVTPLDEADLRESVAACIKSLETLTEAQPSSQRPTRSGHAGGHYTAITYPSSGPKGSAGTRHQWRKSQGAQASQQSQ